MSDISGDTIYSIRQLTDQLRRTLEGVFPFVWVHGEVTNLSRPSSGHLYFSLKDADAQLPCVWFRGQQAGERTFDPMTGEVFEDGPRPCLSASLKNGSQILCAGRISVYAGRGTYQLVVELAQEAGRGALAAAFEERKEKLRLLGYFSEARKRPLPVNPSRVALITAPTGAVIYDFTRLAAERGLGAELRLYPVLVQGEGAAPAIVTAITQANAQAWAQVIVIVRGGGSLEDLWSFNETSVAEAVFASAIPVVAGIGHEVDFTLTDMTADVRAATPSHAAQLLWREKREIARCIDEWELRAQACAATLLSSALRHVDIQDQTLRWFSPVRVVERLQEKERQLARDARLALEMRLQRESRTLERANAALEYSFQPESLAFREKEIAALQMRLDMAWRVYFQSRERQYEFQEAARIQAATVFLRTCEQSVMKADLQLLACDPEAPLRKGYALMRRENGQIVHKVAAVDVGETLFVALHDGELRATVTGKTIQDACRLNPKKLSPHTLPTKKG